MTAVVFGDGGDDVLRRRIRAFGNFIEYVAMCLIMLAIVEIAGASQTVLWSVSGLLVTGRFLHALGMLYANNSVYRGVAMFMTYLCFVVPAVWVMLNWP